MKNNLYLLIFMYNCDNFKEQNNVRSEHQNKTSEKSKIFNNTLVFKVNWGTVSTFCILHLYSR